MKLSNKLKQPAVILNLLILSLSISSLHPFISLLLYTRAGGRIAIGDLLDKLHVWVIQHDMEMLEASDRLQ